MEFPSTAEAIYLTALVVALVIVEKVITQRLLNQQRQELKGLVQEWQGLMALLKALRQQREVSEREKAELQLRKRKLQLQLNQYQAQIQAQAEKEVRQAETAAALDNLVNQP
ncbi:MAG: hypothetical protein IT369_01160 [Candidatus Latescibacteria bacterium]|nr:hypothetical protein [Candidatus Latescibacterota bacterium]